MDLEDIRTYIQDRYQSDLADSKLNEHINEAYADVSKIFTPDTTEESDNIPTVASQVLYTMPVGTRSIKQVYLTDGEGVRIRLRSIKAAAVLYPRVEGTPKRWYPYGFINVEGEVKQQFGVDPVPDDVVTLNVLYEPEATPMEEPDDVPVYVPEELHYLIAWGALALAAGKQEDYNVSQYWEAKYRSAYNDMLTKLGRSSHANFPEAAKQVKE